MPIQIRRETAADAPAIEAITIAAFATAPHSSHTEQHIVRALRQAGELSVSLVASHEGEIVGHVAVSPVTVVAGQGETPAGWYGLGPISVLPVWQGQGMGAQLMLAALAELRSLGAAGCVLLGDPAYYQRFGFRAEAGLVLPGVPAEYFMVLLLRGDLPLGTVHYSNAFEATA